MVDIKKELNEGFDKLLVETPQVQDFLARQPDQELCKAMLRFFYIAGAETAMTAVVAVTEAHFSRIVG